jgi:ribosomal-protein-alanine N-acetyltransferase
MSAATTSPAGATSPASTNLPAGAASVTLREIAWPDLATLASLEAELFEADAWTEATWWAELAQRPRRDYVVAVAVAGGGGGDDPIIGYAGLDHGGSTADVMTIAVRTAYRGRGVGAVLLRELVRRAGARGAEALLLEVRADNAPAQMLYARHGFEQIAVRRRYYQPGDIDAVVMRRMLP